MPVTCSKVVVVAELTVLAVVHFSCYFALQILIPLFASSALLFLAHIFVRLNYLIMEQLVVVVSNLFLSQIVAALLCLLEQSR